MTQLGITSDGSPYTKRLTKRTRRLNLYNQDLVSLDLAVLARAPNLEILELGRNPLRTLDLAPLARCPKLQELVITAAAPVDLGPLQQCANLRSLHVHAQQWPALDLAPLAGLAHFESLHVNGSALPTLDLAPLAACPMLRHLSLHCPSLPQVDLAPLAVCSALDTMGIEHTPLTTLELYPWPNLQYLNFLAVPLKSVDLIPLYASRLKRLRFVDHDLTMVDLTPLAELETLSDLFFKPAPLLVLDDVYAHNPKHISSPAVREHVEAGLCAAAGRFTRLKVLLHRFVQQSPSVAQAYPTMDEATFWRLIADTRQDAADGDLASALMRRLWTLERENLERFFKLFWRIMGRPGEAVHDAVYQVCGGCSDDAFRDFREWLIAQGQETFSLVVNDPDVLDEWGAGGIGFAEGLVSMPLFQVCKARGLPI